MINTYAFFEGSDVNKLNEFVLAFFGKIENQKGPFTEDFFEKEFYDNLVSRHKTILLGVFKEIYETIKDWDQPPKSQLIQSIKNSNEIKKICSGNIVPAKEADIPEEVRDLLTTLFKKLYKDVLFGEFFKEKYSSRKDHYHEFRRYANNDYSICPACGIRPMHNSVEDITDQYDHYLAKDIYPFSSVNFKNLVPVCSDCNSIAVKSNTDILSFTGKAFYPFDPNHQPIQICISIHKNAYKLEDIDWQINYTCEVGKDYELTAWKNIYKIEKRHQNHLKGNIQSWVKEYLKYFNDMESKEDIPDETKRTNSFLRAIKGNLFEHQGLSAILTPIYINAISLSLNNSRYGD